MRVDMTTVLRCLAAAALFASVGARVAQAQGRVSTVTLDPRPTGRPQLGVAADGDGAAVVAWPTFRGSYVSSIDVSARPAGGDFGPRRTVSTGEVAVSSGFALAVGAGGDTALAWRQYVAMRRHPLLVARGRSARRVGTPVAIRPARGAVDSSSAAAIDARGTLLVAWLRSSGRKGCGRVVMASTARRGGPLGAIRRVSGPCAKADQPQVALARNGVGAVTWRAASGGSTDAPRYSLHASVVPHGSPGRERVVSRRPIWFGPAALATGGTRVLLAWREKTHAPEPIGACAQVTWQSGSGRGHLDTAARVALGQRGAARVALGQRGAAIATLRDTCDPNNGVSATRRPVGGAWLPPIGLGMAGARDEQQLASLAAADAGEGVATWLGLPGERSFETGALRVSAYAP